MSRDLGRDLDVAVDQQRFGHTDTRMAPQYSSNFIACLFMDLRLAQLGWTRVSTERDRSLTTGTLRHADGRQ